jgi:hypothetical protein
MIRIKAWWEMMRIVFWMALVFYLLSAKNIWAQGMGPAEEADFSLPPQQQLYSMIKGA